MFTACELCVCATYSAEIATSRGVTVIVLTSSGAGAGFGGGLPQAVSWASVASTARKPALEQGAIRRLIWTRGGCTMRRPRA
jgi:hypothetical protein